MEIEVDPIVQKRREHIGLLVFVLAILLIFVAVFFYVTASRGLDVTASSIDANVNQLNGYSTVVFEGTNTPRQKNATDTTSKILALGANLFNLNNDDDASSDNASSDNNVSNEDLVDANASNVSQFYADKGATICGIKSSDYAAYPNGEVFQRGDWNIGVLSITQEYLNISLAGKLAQINLENPNQAQNTQTQDEKDKKRPTEQSVKTKTPQMIDLQRKIDLLRNENKCDYVILIAPDQAALDLIDKVDCGIFSKVNDEVPDNGVAVGTCFVMRNPDSGNVGTILATPAKMLSARVYSEVEMTK